MTPPPLPARIVLYDGLCGFCNRSVRWLVARDRAARLSFAPLQGETAAALRRRHPEIPTSLDAIGFVATNAAGERVYLRSAALFRLLRELPAPWCWIGALLRLLPRSLCDAAYDSFARRRYRWFGVLAACPVPPAALRARFLA